VNYLLDTNYLIWSLFKTNKIPKETLSILENTSNLIFVSIISLWEISIKHTLGKLEIKQVNIRDIKSAIIEQGFDFIKLEVEDALNLTNLPILKDHKDPFDRMLIQQALTRNYTIITSDNKFKSYKKYGLNTIT